MIYDTSAASGKLRQAAMMIADLMVIPTKLEALGMADIGELIAAFGRPLQVIILPVAYDKRLGVHQYNLGVLQERFGYAGSRRHAGRRHPLPGGGDGIAARHAPGPGQ